MRPSLPHLRNDEHRCSDDTRAKYRAVLAGEGVRINGSTVNWFAVRHCLSVAEEIGSRRTEHVQPIQVGERGCLLLLKRV